MNHVPCTGGRVRNRWTTRVVSLVSFLTVFSISVDSLFKFLQYFHCLLFEHVCQTEKVCVLIPSGEFSWSFNWEWFLCFFILLVFLLPCELRRNNFLLESWRAFYTQEHPCIACVVLIIFFWHGGSYWFGCLLSLSSACAGRYPLGRGCAGSWPAQAPRRRGQQLVPDPGTLSSSSSLCRPLES